MKVVKHADVIDLKFIHDHLNDAITASMVIDICPVDAILCNFTFTSEQALRENSTPMTLRTFLNDRDFNVKH